MRQVNLFLGRTGDKNTGSDASRGEWAATTNNTTQADSDTVLEQGRGRSGGVGNDQPIKGNKEQPQQPIIRGRPKWKPAHNTQYIENNEPVTMLLSGQHCSMRVWRLVLVAVQSIRSQIRAAEGQAAQAPSLINLLNKLPSILIWHQRAARKKGKKLN